ncbi:MAG: glutathione S-transferase [Deltaproteobacteria bacterium]|nr:MAG: glutathione S-transferase [Deltaproteobacteria bacterium]
MPKLTYFNFPGGRGEDCRIALHIAGVDFEDDRVNGPDWPARKPGSPFGNMPIYEEDGRILGQSNAILGYLGRKHGLLPEDPWEQARHVAILNHAEDLRWTIGGTFSLDAEAKQAAREKLTAGAIPQWAARAEAQLGEGPFLAGDQLSVADLKLFVVMKWIIGGGLDHIPASVFDGSPRLLAHFEAVSGHPGVQSWYAR